MEELDFSAVVAARREQANEPIPVRLGSRTLDDGTTEPIIIHFKGVLPLDGLLRGVIAGQEGDDLSGAMIMSFLRANLSDEDLEILAASGLEQPDLGDLYQRVTAVITGRPTRASSNSSPGQPGTGGASNDNIQAASGSPSADSATPSTH